MKIIMTICFVPASYTCLTMLKYADRHNVITCVWLPSSSFYLFPSFSSQFFSQFNVTVGGSGGGGGVLTTFHFTDADKYADMLNDFPAYAACIVTKRKRSCHQNMIT